MNSVGIVGYWKIDYLRSHLRYIFNSFVPNMTKLIFNLYQNDLFKINVFSKILLFVYSFYRLLGMFKLI